MKQASQTRFNAATINQAAPVIQAPLLSWDVAASAGGEPGYRVDLSQFAEGINPNSPPLVHHALARRRIYRPGRPGYLNVAAHPALIRALAPSLRIWSASVSRRTVNENLSQLKHLFNFLATAADILEVAPSNQSTRIWQLTDMSPELFNQFAEYLRRLNLSSSRMSSIYVSTRLIVESAAGMDYLPSSPFSTLPDGEGSPQYSYQQMKALLDIAKNIIRNFKQTRKDFLTRDRNGETRQFIRERLQNGAIRFNERPDTVPRYASHEVFPCLRVASAFVLLSLLRSGANLQPVLDLTPRDWNQPNPFSSKYRTVVMTKNRRGHTKNEKIVRIPTLKRPQFYLYRALRYYELLIAPLKAAITARKEAYADSSVQRERYVATLDGRFWLHINNNLETTQLNENAAIRGINMLIAEACVRSPESYACLLTSEGEPIRFSSKAIRDGWFEFVLRNSKYNLAAGQIALSHSTDSPSIRHYTRHRWARQFTDRQMRRFHSAAIAVLDETAVEFSPQAIRVTLDGGDILALDRKNRARYGAYCRDPLDPPADIYKPQHEEDSCPAISCDDCPYANYFTSSLPELMAEIEMLELRSAEIPTYVWEGSEDWERLGRLNDLLSRFPTTAVEAAKEEVSLNSVPNIRFRIQKTS